MESSHGYMQTTQVFLRVVIPQYQFLHCIVQYVMTIEGFNKPRKYCFSESFLTNENISTVKYSIFNCVPISNVGLLYYGHSTDAAPCPSTAEV